MRPLIVLAALLALLGAAVVATSGATQADGGSGADPCLVLSANIDEHDVESPWPSDGRWSNGDTARVNVSIIASGCDHDLRNITITVTETEPGAALTLLSSPADVAAGGRKDATYHLQMTEPLVDTGGLPFVIDATYEGCASNCVDGGPRTFRPHVELPAALDNESTFHLACLSLSTVRLVDQNVNGSIWDEGESAIVGVSMYNRCYTRGIGEVQIWMTSSDPAAATLNGSTRTADQLSSNGQLDLAMTTVRANGSGDLTIRLHVNASGCSFSAPACEAVWVERSFPIRRHLPVAQVQPVTATNDSAAAAGEQPPGEFELMLFEVAPVALPPLLAVGYLLAVETRRLEIAAVAPWAHLVSSDRATRIQNECEAIMRLVDEHGPSSLKELMKETGISERATRHRLATLMEEGRLERLGASRRTVYVVAGYDRDPSSMVHGPRDLLRLLVELKRAGQTMPTQTELAVRCSMAQSTVSTWLFSLTESGLIHGSGPRGRIRFTPTEKGVSESESHGMAS